MSPTEVVTPEQLLRLMDVLDRDNEAGRLTLIHRMGASKIESALPPLLSTGAAREDSAAEAGLCAGLAAARVLRGVAERSSTGAWFGVVEQAAKRLAASARAQRRSAGISIRGIAIVRSSWSASEARF